MSETYDVIIKHSKIVDGTGKPAFNGSIAIKGEKIVAVGDVKGDAAREIDGSGLIASPGFIDIHQHGDRGILLYPRAENYVMQGITTFVAGNCGTFLAPLKDYIQSYGLVSGWWSEAEPYSSGPPPYLPLEKYRKIMEEKLGFAIDWRTFGEYLSKVEQLGISVNWIPLAGHNTFRVAAMGMDFQRRAKPSEIEEMKGYVDEAMRSGAHGFTANLDGIPGPGDYASTAEVIELAKVAQKHGGLYATHMRNADNNYPGKPEEYGYGICHNITPEEMPVSKYYALLEAIEICREAKIPTQLSHVMNVYLIHQYFPEYLQEACARATLDVIDNARKEGLDLTFDIMPVSDVHAFMMTAAPLINLFSKWLKLSGSKERFVENLKITEFRDELRREIMGGKFKFNMIHPKTDPYWMDRPYILACKNKMYEGKTIGEIARSRNSDPIDTVFDILIEDPDAQFNCTDPRWTETTVRVFVQHPTAMIGSDISVTPSLSRPPPDAVWTGAAKGVGFYGGYARYISWFVREKAYLSLEEAFKKASYLPAQRFGLDDRGVISPGAYADVLVFDFENIREKGTQLDPRHAPEGIHHTIVNGKIVYENMAHTGTKSGKVLRHK